MLTGILAFNPWTPKKTFINPRLGTTSLVIGTTSLKNVMKGRLLLQQNNHTANESGQLQIYKGWLDLTKNKKTSSEVVKQVNSVLCKTSADVSAVLKVGSIA